MTMQKVAWPMIIVQKLNGICSSPKAERSAMAVTMPGSASGRTRRNESASRPKKRLRETAAAARDPSMTAIRVATSATLTERNSAAHTSLRPQATANQAVVKPGRGKRKVESSVVKAYRTTTAKGRCRKRRAPTAASFTARGARRPLERIEGSQSLGSQQVDRHHGHRHDGEGGRQRDVPGGALKRQDGLTDKVGRIPKRVGHDEITQRQREGEDRAGHDPRQRQRKRDRAKGLGRTGAQVGRRLQQRAGHALQAGDDRQ